VRRQAFEVFEQPAISGWSTNARPPTCGTQLNPVQPPSPIINGQNGRRGGGKSKVFGFGRWKKSRRTDHRGFQMICPPGARTALCNSLFVPSGPAWPGGKTRFWNRFTITTVGTPRSPPDKLLPPVKSRLGLRFPITRATRVTVANPPVGFLGGIVIDMIGSRMSGNNPHQRCVHSTDLLPQICTRGNMPKVCRACPPPNLAPGRISTRRIPAAGHDLGAKIR